MRTEGSYERWPVAGHGKNETENTQEVALMTLSKKELDGLSWNTGHHRRPSLDFYTLLPSENGVPLGYILINFL